MKEPHIPYDLIAKQFTGQCSEEENTLLTEWINSCTENEELYRKLEKQWNESRPDTSGFVIPDKQKVWANIQEEIERKVPKIPLYPKSLLLKIAGIAAVIALVAGFALSYMLQTNLSSNNSEEFRNIVMAPSGQKTQLVLPDGTQVWLNSESQLVYTYQYNRNERVVILDGEAYFDVEKKEGLPFIVKAGPVDIRVLGTSFNVSAYSKEENISVSLVSGRLGLLRSADQEHLTFLQPNESAIISRHDMACKVISCDAGVEASWHLNKLKFDGADTREIWKKLERWYGVKVTLENVDPENRYWFSVKTESLTELLEMINRLTPMEYSLSGEEVHIRYK